MLKVKPHRQGLSEYIRLADLPDKQAGNLLEWLPQSYLTKVKGAEDKHDDCVDYEDYEFWFEHCFQKDIDLLEEEI